MPRSLALSRMSPKLAPALAAALLWGSPLLARADVLRLEGGGRLEGILVEESPARVTLEVSTGRVTVPRSHVVSIERAESALATFRARRASVAAGDLDALIDLARFAGLNGLSAEAREAWTLVLGLDPSNGEAHRTLGHVRVGGSWMEPEEAYRAQGLVPFDGRFVTPAEQTALLREREQRANDDRRVDEARRAAREAEDRARRAEAEAARVRAEAARAMNPSPWGYGGPVIVAGPRWSGGGSGCVRLPCDPEPPRPVATAPTPAPQPQRARPRPSSIH